MNSPITRSGRARKLAAVVLAPVLAISATTVGLTALTSAPASAACAAGLDIASGSASAKGKPSVKASKPSVKKSGKNWVATATVKGTFGSASVVVSDTVCTGDTAGHALSWTYSGSGHGTASKKVTGKGKTKAAAKKAEAKAVTKAKKTLTASLKKHGKDDAIDAAIDVAAAKATGLSHVIYLTHSGSTVTASKTVSGPAVLISQSGANLNLNVPAGYDIETAATLSCISKASTWPAAYVFDGGFKQDGYTVPGTGSVTFSDAQALADAAASQPEIDAYSLLDASDSGTFAWAWGWDTTGAPTGDFSPSRVAGSLVCFAPFDLPAGTVTLHNPRIAAGQTENDDVTPKTITLTKPIPVKLG